MKRKRKWHLTAAQQPIRNFVHTLEETPISLSGFFVAFTTIIIVRMMEQQWLDGFPHYSAQGQFFEFAQTFLFFLFSMILFMFLFYGIVRVRPEKSANVLLVGFLIMLFPPLFDTLRFGIFWSYYEFGGINDMLRALWTVFATTPSMGVTDGNRIEIVLSAIVLGFYAYMHTKSRLRGIYMACATYLILFVLASLPSWIAIMVYGWQHGFSAVSGVHVAQMFLSPNPVLVRDIKDINIVLHLHMSIIYALGVGVSGILLTRTFFGNVWRIIKRAFMHYDNMVALTFFGGGIGMVFIFGLQSLSLFSLSFFAIPALLLLVVAVFSLSAGSVLLYKHIDKNGSGRVVAIPVLIYALFSGTIVNNFIGVLMLGIIAVTLIGTLRPFEFYRYIAIHSLLYSVRNILFYMIGIAAVFDNTDTVLTGWRFLVFIALLSIGLILTIRMRPSRKFFGIPLYYILSLYWFFLMLSSLVFFNIFAYKWFILCVAFCLSYALYAWGQGVCARKYGV